MQGVVSSVLMHQALSGQRPRRSPPGPALLGWEDAFPPQVQVGLHPALLSNQAWILPSPAPLRLVVLFRNR